MSKIAFWLLVIGGINWLLVGLFNRDVGGLLLGGMDSWPARILYILVGLSAFVVLKGKTSSPSMATTM